MDRPLTNFHGNKFRGSRFPLATPSLGSRLIHQLLTVVATPCSVARFALLVELRLGPSWFVCLSSSTTRLKLETPPIDKCNQCRQRNLRWRPPRIWNRSLETTIECIVALDVHAILQKWNSYHFISTLYHLPVWYFSDAFVLLPIMPDMAHRGC